MKTDLLSILEVALVAGTLAVVGCSSDSTGDDAAKGTDSAAPGADAGCPAAHAGCPAADAGCPAAHAGCPATDAGCPATHAGCPAAAGDDQTPPTGDAATIDAWIATGAYLKWTCEKEPHDGRSPSPHSKNRICSNAKVSGNGGGAYPVGSAAVKELYDADGKTIVGHAMYRKLEAGVGGDAWYWFEETEANGLIANGTGASGSAKSVCVGCHSGAPNDFVYTQVK